MIGGKADLLAQDQLHAFIKLSGIFPAVIGLQLAQGIAGEAAHMMAAHGFRVGLIIFNPLPPAEGQEERQQAHAGNGQKPGAGDQGRLHLGQAPRGMADGLDGWRIISRGQSI